MGADTKGSNGPWDFTPDPELDQGFIVWGEEGGTKFCVAEVRTEEDAHLIAAAPALYEALAAHLASFESQHALLLEIGAPDFVQLRDMARTALASARGEV